MTRLTEAFFERWRERRFERRLAQARRKPAADIVTRLSRALIAEWRFDEAEALLETGLAHAPESSDLLEQYAVCAQDSGRKDEALARWRRLAALRPDLPMAWCGISANARELGLHDAAAAALDEARRRFPDTATVLAETARTRELGGAHGEAVDLWRRALAHSRGDESWHLALARNLILLERYDEVEAILVGLQAGRRRRSADVQRNLARQWCEVALGATDPVVYTRHAVEAVPRFGDEAYAVPQVANLVTDVEAACLALRRVVERAPKDFEALTSYAVVLMRAERYEDAERQVERAAIIAPDHESLFALRALIAIRRQDWNAAHAFATAFVERAPEDSHATWMLERVRRMLQLDQAQHNPARRVPIAPALCDDPEIRQLVLKFESFGEDCEFGTVQRRYGAEPLGLLRWTQTDVASLMAALEGGLEGIGDPENTELAVETTGEVLIRDTRWNLAMHTFLYEHEVSLPVLLPKMCRRTAYLRDKLLDELRSGQKTLIFKSDDPDRADLVALHDALLSLGPNRLLNVRQASGFQDIAGGEPGTIDEIRPGLFVGHLSRVAELDHIVYDEWIDVCRRMDQLREASEAAAAAEMASA